MVEEDSGSLPLVFPYPLVEVGFVDDERGSVVRPVLEVGLVEEDNRSLLLVLPYPLVEVGLVDDERGSVVRLFPK